MSTSVMRPHARIVPHVQILMDRIRVTVLILATLEWTAMKVSDTIVYLSV